MLVTAGDACCGITWISTGQLDGAKQAPQPPARACSGPFAVNGIPIIGVEPSCTAVLRGDLLELLPNDPRAHAVARGTFTLAEVLTGRAPGEAPRGLAASAPRRRHRRRAAALPPVLGASASRADRDLFARAGATVTEASGCCGLAGNWGYDEGPLRRLGQGRGELPAPALRPRASGPTRPRASSTSRTA